MRLSAKTIIERQQTTNTGVGSEFVKDEIDGSVASKGYRVIHVKAYRCPCKERVSSEETQCKNCGGGGWFWANPTLTKMVISGITSKQAYESEGRLNLGSVNVTANEQDKLSFMDAIVILDAVSEHTEVLYPAKTNDATTLFSMTKYDIKKIDFLGLFEGVGAKIKRLIEGADFTYIDNKISLANQYLNLVDSSITIRYQYAPVYHIVDIRRDAMRSVTNYANIGETIIELPVHAVAERAHLIKEAENFAGSRLFDNSWLPTPCEEEEMTDFERQIKYAETQFIWNTLTSKQKEEMAILAGGSVQIFVNNELVATVASGQTVNFDTDFDFDFNIVGT